MCVLVLHPEVRARGRGRGGKCGVASVECPFSLMSSVVVAVAITFGIASAIWRSYDPPAPAALAANAALWLLPARRSSSE